MTSYITISPAELIELERSHGSVHVIDVRTPMEYQEVHLSVAHNIPLDQLISSKIPQDGQPVIFVCKSGSRGQMAAEKAVSAGLKQVYNVEGGTMACVDSGMAVNRGKKAMSLERQVRIAAGGLVSLGAVLGWTAHHYFFGLSAFIGAGLVFAGVTDTCAMGMLIAKMPWNQVPKSTATCQN